VPDWKVGSVVAGGVKGIVLHHASLWAGHQKLAEGRAGLIEKDRTERSVKKTIPLMGLEETAIQPNKEWCLGGEFDFFVPSHPNFTPFPEI
jgi:hypothetical protein